MDALTHLWSPIRIKDLELANRAVMPAMGTLLGNPDGTVSDALCACMKRRAKSGVGLVITEVTAVHPTAVIDDREIGAYEDRFIPGLKRLAETIHKAGARAAVQLHHAGRESFYLLKKGEAVAPSALPSLVYGLTAREMTIKEIREIIQAFGQAAVRVRQAGFDAVEVHGAHGYLLTQFLSALSNRREDEYGGDFKNRARFVLEVVQEVRQSVGPDFPIILRLSCEEFIKGGYTVEDVQTILPDLVRAGADVIHASIGTHGSPGGVSSASAEYEPGFNVWRARKVKETVDVPVIAVGRFSEPALADEVIARGEADLVAFGRQQLADPDFLIKAREGRPEQIRKCLACNQGCIERLILEGRSIRCAINPETGQELAYPRGWAKVSRQVWVVGAGPAGLTAASEAARLGHKVTLFEKEDHPGGQVRFAGRAPHKELYAQWLDGLIDQVRRRGVKIQTKTPVTAAMLAETQPEVVILAVGAEPIRPDVPGLDRPMVGQASAILEGRIRPGREVLVVGGGLIGMETADFLLAQGSRVTVIEQLPKSPVTKAAAHGYMLHKRLQTGGCHLSFNTVLKSIQEDSVTVTNAGQEEEIRPVDQVVLAAGMKPCSDLIETLETLKIRYFVVGDAAQVRRIIEAVEEGARAAWEV